MNNEQIDKAEKMAKEVFSESCADTRWAIDYMAVVLRANLAAPAPVDAGTIDTPEFRNLLGEYLNAFSCQRIEGTDRALVAHIDRHVAATVTQKQDVIGLLNRQYCELETALANEHDEVIKLRTAAGVGEPCAWLCFGPDGQALAFSPTEVRGLDWAPVCRAATAPVSAEKIRGFDRSLAAVDAHDPQSFIDGAKWAEAKLGATISPSAGAPVSAAEQAPGRLIVTVAHNRIGATVLVSLQREGVTTMLYASDHPGDRETTSSTPVPVELVAAILPPAHGQELPALPQEMRTPPAEGSPEYADGVFAGWNECVEAFCKALAMRQPQGDDALLMEFAKAIDGVEWEQDGWHCSFCGARGVEHSKGIEPHQPTCIVPKAKAVIAAKQAGKEGALAPQSNTDKELTK